MNVAKRRRPGGQPCKVCGTLTHARYGICQRTYECLIEAQYAYKNGRLRQSRTCLNCDGPLRRDAKYGFCLRNPECYRLAKQARRQANPEKVREENRRQWAKQTQEQRDRRLATRQTRYQKEYDRCLIIRRLHGVRNAGLAKGWNHPNWKGGKLAFCCVCGQCVGWRQPAWFKKHKHAFCTEHKYDRVRWGAKVTRGKAVSCFTCGQAAGYRFPYQLRQSKAFFCEQHKHEGWKVADRKVCSVIQFCCVCGESVGMKAPSQRRICKRFFCKEHWDDGRGQRETRQAV